MTDTKNTILSPAPEHDEKCRHTDCVGECCEPCANMPKAEERRPKIGDDVVNLVGGTYRGFRVSYVNNDCLEATTGGHPFIARIVRTIDKRGVTWNFDEPVTKQPVTCPLCGDPGEKNCSHAFHYERRISNQATLIDERTRERDESRRVRDEYRTSHDKAMGLLAEAQKERDELARKLEGAKAEGRRELAREFLSDMAIGWPEMLRKLREAAK